MQKVVTINLNGQAYQSDEDAYEAIHAYLDREEMAPVEATSDSAAQKAGPQSGDFWITAKSSKRSRRTSC